MSIADDIRKGYRPKTESPNQSISEIAQILFNDAVKKLKEHARNGFTEDKFIGNFITKKVKVASQTYWIHFYDDKSLSINYGSESREPTGIYAQNESEVRAVLSALKQLCNNEGINVERCGQIHSYENLTIRFWIQV